MSNSVLVWVLFSVAIIVAFYSGRYWTYRYGFFLWLGGLAIATGVFLAAHLLPGRQFLPHPFVGISMLTLVAVFSDPELYRSGARKLFAKVVSPLLDRLTIPSLPKPRGRG